MIRRHRRDFLLDSGAVSWLAHDQAGQTAFLKHVVDDYTDAAIVVPHSVLTECYTGYPSTDVQVDRLLKAIGPGYLPVVNITLARQGGMLRTQAMRTLGRRISATDAEVVAIAEQRSYQRAVTIMTSDPKDIAALVSVTSRTNIHVEPI